MSYVDGFVVPVPKRSKQAYVRMARTAGKVWLEHGALACKECIADDVKKGKRLAAMMDPKNMPFDGKRFICGGCKVMVDL